MGCPYHVANKAANVSEPMGFEALESTAHSPHRRARGQVTNAVEASKEKTTYEKAAKVTGWQVRIVTCSVPIAQEVGTCPTPPHLLKVLKLVGGQRGTARIFEHEAKSSRKLAVWD